MKIKMNKNSNSNSNKKQQHIVLCVGIEKRSDLRHRAESCCCCCWLCGDCCRVKQPGLHEELVFYVY